MLAIVSRNPSDVCRVSAVPTACDGTDLVTIVLNCAESAMTKNPHSHATATMAQTLDANKPPMTTAQLPLTAMARITSRSCPIRSATQPPHTHPNPPTAMAPNASRPSTAPEGTTPPARACARYGTAFPTVSAPTTVPIARPRPEENHVAIIFMAGGYTPARQNPVKKRETRASG